MQSIILYYILNAFLLQLLQKFSGMLDNLHQDW